jgi:hypothetical protein
MASGGQSLMDRLRAKARDGYWRRAVERAKTIDLFSLKRLRAEAKASRSAIDAVIEVADARLQGQLADGTRLHRLAMTDWAWRPALWRQPTTPAGHAMAEKLTVLDAETSLHHDCKVSEITMRQRKNLGLLDLAPRLLDLEVFGFDGSFLSLSVRLPDESLAGLTSRHIIRLDLSVEDERPVKVLARLNMQSGPNVARIVQETSGVRQRLAEFDLGHSGVDDERMEKAWIDLFFEAPQMNRITLHDLTLSRRPRAEF